MFKAYCSSPLGEILLLSEGETLCGLYFADRQTFDAPQRDLPIFRQTKEWLNSYFAGENPEMSIPVTLPGTEFQREVWEILKTIPYGTTVSYGAIAKQVGQNRGIPRMSAQAVGNAVGKNPVSIVVPCHRVIGADKTLVGYGGGLNRKLFLLQLENRVKI